MIKKNCQISGVKLQEQVLSWTSVYAFLLWLTVAIVEMHLFLIGILLCFTVATASGKGNNIHSWE